MCYAIPGKVVEINNNIVTVDYFGEKKKARNEFYELLCGDYVYAQGGFVIQKIPEDEAIEILNTWQEFFFKLQETDLRLTREPKGLHQIANSIRQKYHGNSCCVHGIIEFSNYCRNNCFYCGIRKDNKKLQRYRMDIDEIVDTCDYAVNKLKFKALVLQSGEDLWYDEDKLVDMVKKIRNKCAVLLVLSIGERDIKTYKKLYQSGVRGVLLRFETSNPGLYERYRPGYNLEDRISLIKELREMGYLIFTGFLIGLPGQNEQDILNDIHLTNSLDAEMFSFGPLIPHPETPFRDVRPVSLELVLNTIARARILYPRAKILVVTALETLDKEDGARQGLLSGANSLMINVTPQRYQKLYDIYPVRAGSDEEINTRINNLLQLFYSLGRAPTDISLSEL